MPFSKPAGLRLTDIQLESCSNVIHCYSSYNHNEQAAKHIFKIETLFPNQTLDIKNCVLDIELFDAWVQLLIQAFLIDVIPHITSCFANSLIPQLNTNKRIEFQSLILTYFKYRLVIGPVIVSQVQAVNAPVTLANKPTTIGSWRILWRNCWKCLYFSSNYVGQRWRLRVEVRIL